ncbi:hypothetical protein BpHYR1_049933 [Brachionus plicatilis]|uniref:Uncharacterized protein n=1 Tax=Brachionus plicatilis TaxID=10195 RepID=A0A3M7RWL4_BRAPC|nr:hypothetical protein BpHYR1_049933 [Brachionus plicatilis]
MIGKRYTLGTELKKRNEKRFVHDKDLIVGLNNAEIEQNIKSMTGDKQSVAKLEKSLSMQSDRWYETKTTMEHNDTKTRHLFN